MPSHTDFPARGKIIRVDEGFVIFTPSNTNYEIKLLTASAYEGPVNTLVEGMIHASARKIWTVASGGNFISPIFGPPRIVQGRIKFLDQNIMVVQAGPLVTLNLPKSDWAYDLTSGAISVGALVNTTVMPGASFMLLGSTVAV